MKKGTKNKILTRCLYILLAVIACRADAQTDFRFDSIVYKTMYPKDLCAFIGSHPRLLLLDVRSPGEFADTSIRGSLNIGHLKNAVNIFIDSISEGIPAALKQYVNEPVVVYCSHSQRSRRVCRILVENGFTQVRNLNGGMTWMNQASETDFPCKKKLIVSLLPYKNSPANEAIELLRANKDLLILDVRPLTQFEGRDTIESTNIGRLKKAINIPEKELKNSLQKLAAHKNKAILIYDHYGAESSVAATFLAAQGFTQVYHLVGGMLALIGKEYETTKTRDELLENTPAYRLVNVKETIDLVTTNKDLIIFDIRPEDEYNNTAKQEWKNLGHFKKAIHIAPDEFSKKLPELMVYKNNIILVYGSAGVAGYCKKLKEAGFKEVNLLYNGLWDMVSTSANVYGFKSIKSLMEGYAGLY